MKKFIPEINHPQDIVPTLLKRNLELLKEQNPERLGEVNIILAKRLVEISLKLGQQEVFEEANDFFQEIRIDPRLKVNRAAKLGAPAEKPSELQNKDFKVIPSLEELDKKYPESTSGHVVSRLRNTVKEPAHLRYLLANNITSGLQLCKNELQYEEAAAVLAVMGNFDRALEMRDRITKEVYRKVEVDQTLSIEYFRREKFPESFAIMSSFIGNWDNPAVNMRLAMGFSKIDPYPTYPLPES